MELFTRQAAVALFFGLFATSTQAKEFSYLETFDDDATFSAGATLPDGPFYVAFEFSDGLWFDEPDANVSRTEVGFGGFTHRSKVTTLYVQPTAVPETSTFVPDGSYCPVDALDAEYKGLGLNLVAWANVKGSETSVALTSDGSVAFDARLDGDLLTVSGTHAGETVLVSDVAGKTVATAKASAESTALSLSNVPAGLYIVKTDLGARKFVKK